jgi:transposase
MLRQMERSTIHTLAKRGQSRRKIAQFMGISRNTVSRVLEEPVERVPLGRERSSAVDDYRSQIEGWLRQGLSIVRMLELARADQDCPYRGGRSTFSDRVRKIRREQERKTADVPIRFEGLPGEYLQVDWGKVRRFPFTQRQTGRKYFLCCRLKYSRWSWMMWTEDMRQETLLRGLVDCFCALGFVPWVLVFDNMKTVTTGRNAANEAIWHPALARLSAEFGFHPQACAVARGNQKGSVENLVKWVKGNFLPGRSFADDADLAGQAVQWVAEANARKNDATGRPPLERLHAEAAQGGKLPVTASDYGFMESARVSAESLVHLGGNSYSVPVSYVGMTLTARLHRNRVALFHDGDQVAEHERMGDGGRARRVDPAHFEAVFAKKPRAKVMLYRQALLDLGSVAERYVGELSCRRRDRLGEQVIGTHALLERYGKDALLDGMERMAALDAYGTEYLEAALASGATSDLRSVLEHVPVQAEVDRELAQYESFAIISVGGGER